MKEGVRTAFQLLTVYRKYGELTKVPKVSDKLYHHIKLYQVHIAMDLPKVSDKLYHHIKLYQVHLTMDQPKVSDKLPSHKDVSGTPHNGPAKSH